MGPPWTVLSLLARGPRVLGSRTTRRSDDGIIMVLVVPLSDIMLAAEVLFHRRWTSELEWDQVGHLR